MWVLRVWYQELWGFIPFSLVFSASSFQPRLFDLVFFSSLSFPAAHLPRQWTLRTSCFESWRDTEKKTRW